jgi:hypothetical protein
MLLQLTENINHIRGNLIGKLLLTIHGGVLENLPIAQITEIFPLLWNQMVQYCGHKSRKGLNISLTLILISQPLVTMHPDITDKTRLCIAGDL